MNTETTILKSGPDTDFHSEATAEPLRSGRGVIYQRLVTPLLTLLRQGASPKRLAWSIAVGLIIGINPMLGTTTVLCFAAAMLLRLNIAASQLANHLMYPLQLILVVPFLQLGSYIFHTAPVPFSTSALLSAARKDPAEFILRIWRWEWHAFLVWSLIAVILVPLLALLLTPVMRRLSMLKAARG